MKLPQFTIRDLLLSTALIAAGISAPLTAPRIATRLGASESVLAALVLFGFLAAPLLIFAGILLPLGKARSGAFIGFVAVAIAITLYPFIRHLFRSL